MRRFVVNCLSSLRLRPRRVLSSVDHMQQGKPPCAATSSTAEVHRQTCLPAMWQAHMLYTFPCALTRALYRLQTSIPWHCSPVTFVYSASSCVALNFGKTEMVKCIVLNGHSTSTTFHQFMQVNFHHRQGTHRF